MSTTPETADPKIAEGIAYFEDIVKVMPNDRTALEFLSVAYGQIGEAAKQKTALVRLAHVLVKTGDFDAAKQISALLEQFPDPDAQAAVLRVRAALPETREAALAAQSAEQPAAAAAPNAAPATLERELKLLEFLQTRQIVDAALAEKIAAELRNLENADAKILISAMAILEKENGALCEAALAALADEFHAPPVSLAAFDLTAPAARLLPYSFACAHGVFPFAKLANTVLAAAVNPAVPDLAKTVAAQLGCDCRIFLAAPLSVEEAIESLRENSGEAPQ